MLPIRGFIAIVALSTMGMLNAQAQLQAQPQSVYIWPQIPFVRGKDLCQYHDAYGQTKSEQMATITNTIRNLLREGVDPRSLATLLTAMDGQINLQRAVAGSSPGMDVSVAPTPRSAEMACQGIKARLPTEDEYEYLSNVGDWNGGVTCSRNKLWAMANNMVMAPDLRNPSPVRPVTEFPGQVFSYYCVR
jgi:hypothetical protein